MPDAQQPRRPSDLRIGDWLVQPTLNRLTLGESVHRVRPQLVDLLVCLAARQGRVVPKEELLAEVWPDRFISESGLVRCIAELRQVFEDDAQQPRFIETIAKRGYRLIAPVEWLQPVTEAGPSAEPVQPAEPGSPGIDPGPSVVEEVGEAAPARARRPSRHGWYAAAATLLIVAAVGAVVWFAPRARTLTEQDTLVLAFENTTGDAVFAETLPLALAVHLEQSPFLRILPAERVRETLRLMGQSPDTELTRALGIEVCERAGATALVVGSIAALGEHYALGLEAVACGVGEVLARQQVEVSGKEEVLAGLGRLSSAIRARLGESLASVERHNVPITEATTSSLEALRAVRRGDAARNRGEDAEALALYREAVRLDPEFALAQMRLGALALAAHLEAEGLAAASKAYSLRDRVTLPERLEIDIVYHWNFTGDQDRVTEALETMRRAYPRMALARRGLANHYQFIGRYEESLAEALEALRLDARSARAMTAVAWAYLFLDRHGEARKTVESAIALGIDTPELHTVLLQSGFVTGDAALVAREREWASSHPEAAPWFLESEAEDAVWRGRLRDSVAFLEQNVAWAEERGAAQRSTVLRLRIARYQALCGRTQEARAAVARELAAGLDDHMKIEALKVTVSAGDLETTSRLIADLDKAGWPGSAQPDAWFVLTYRAAVEAGRGRPEQALAMLRPLVPYETGLAWGFIPLFERAQAHLKAGDWEEARAAFQTMLAHRAVSSGQKLLPGAQLGIARALAAGGLTGESRRAYEQFFDLWKEADPDLPLLAEARREYASLK